MIHGGPISDITVLATQTQQRIAWKSWWPHTLLYPPCIHRVLELFRSAACGSVYQNVTPLKEVNCYLKRSTVVELHSQWENGRWIMNTRLFLIPQARLVNPPALGFPRVLKCHSSGMQVSSRYRSSVQHSLVLGIRWLAVPCSPLCFLGHYDFISTTRCKMEVWDRVSLFKRIVNSLRGLCVSSSFFLNIVS